MKYFLIFLLIIFSFSAFAEEKKKGFSTLPGWSAGYRYSLDLDDNDDDKLRLFGKYKQRTGNVVKFGIDIKHDRNSVEGGAIFIEQEFKF